MCIPRYINSSLAFSTIFSQDCHHISFEGQCFSFMICTSRKLRTTKSEQSWLDENIEAFPGHLEYAIGPLACKIPCRFCNNVGRHATEINLQYLHFRVMYANTSKDPLPWNNYHAKLELFFIFFKDAIFWRVPEGGSPIWCCETL